MIFCTGGGEREEAVFGRPVEIDGCVPTPLATLMGEGFDKGEDESVGLNLCLNANHKIIPSTRSETTPFIARDSIPAMGGESF
jgi:hypothetical protein